MFCKNCGTQIKEGARFCASCGTAVTVIPSAENQNTQKPSFNYGAPSAPKPVGKRKKTAGLLGIFLGALGVHRFYLGYTGIALIQIVLFTLGLATFGITALASFAWGIVDAIRILSGRLNKDADDNPLI